ncbi:VOC family protein [Actinocatenispora rupis]|uniref:Glyoxalase n=2 Tax=Actinocatenispora rupis TaxID=519421 RepID=A0A8J3J6K2_9ACTN|nr:glyoxalase [Actinocatenispora rupis]
MSFAIGTVWVLDQDSAHDFYTTKLGFEVRHDVLMGPQRWLTVGPPGQPDIELALMLAAPPALDPESAGHLRALIAKGVLGAAAFHTDDCRATHRELSARGVSFVQDPTDRPYGTEALFRDDSGNWFSLTQPRAELDRSLDWHNGAAASSP